MSFAKFLLLGTIATCELFLAHTKDKDWKSKENIHKNDITETLLSIDKEKSSVALLNISKIIPKKEVGTDYQGIPHSYGFVDYQETVDYYDGSGTEYDDYEVQCPDKRKTTRHERVTNCWDVTLQCLGGCLSISKGIIHLP